MSTSLPDTAREQRGEEVGEVLLHVGERLREDRHDLLVDGLDDAVELAPARLHVFELGLEELVAFEQRVVLLERERVDRAHEPQLAVEVAGAAGERGAGGHLGCGRVERDRRLDVVLGAQPSRPRSRAGGGSRPRRSSRRCSSSRTSSSSCSALARVVRSSWSWSLAAAARSASARRAVRQRPSISSMRSVSSPRRPPIAGIRARAPRARPGAARLRRGARDRGRVGRRLR